MKILQSFPHIGNQFPWLFLSHFNDGGRVYAFGFTALVFLDGAIARAMFLVNISKYRYVVDVDIKGFFDNVDHGNHAACPAKILITR